MSKFNITSKSSLTIIILLSVVGGSLVINQWGGQEEIEYSQNGLNANESENEGAVYAPLDRRTREEQQRESEDKGIDSDHRDEYQIRFPSGESVGVTLALRLETTTGPEVLADAYDSLRAAAESGDAEASYVLHQSLIACQRAVTDAADLAKVTKSLRDTGYLTLPDSGHSIPIEPDDIPKVERNLHSQFSFCQGLTVEQLGESNTWLVKAADNGHSLAQLFYGRDLLRREKSASYEEASRYLEAAWLDGHIDSLQHLAKIYRDGRLDRPPFVQPDPVAGYGYFYAFAKLTEARVSGGGDIAKRMAAALEQELDQQASSLSQHDIDAAMWIAKDLIKNNRNCCQK